MLGKIEEGLNQSIAQKGCLFILLLDPDSASPTQFIQAGMDAAENGVDALFVGGSFIGNPNFSKMTAELAEKTKVPVILFPGGASQVTPGPKAILFTTLISGRNPQFLIDEQVRGSVLVKAYGMEPIPTAYVLIESGRTTAVEYISQTKPIPSDKPMIASAHALAAEMMGQRWIYLEAGSGAMNPVPVEFVTHVRSFCSMNVLVGGGIRTPEAARERAKAGAHGVVVGTVYERLQDKNLLAELSDAIHNP